MYAPRVLENAVAIGVHLNRCIVAIGDAGQGLAALSEVLGRADLRPAVQRRAAEHSRSKLLDYRKLEAGSAGIGATVAKFHSADYSGKMGRRAPSKPRANRCFHYRFTAGLG